MILVGAPSAAREMTHRKCRMCGSDVDPGAVKGCCTESSFAPALRVRTALSGFWTGAGSAMLASLSGCRLLERPATYVLPERLTTGIPWCELPPLPEPRLRPAPLDGVVRGAAREVGVEVAADVGGGRLQHLRGRGGAPARSPPSPPTGFVICECAGQTNGSRVRRRFATRAHVACVCASCACHASRSCRRPARTTSPSPSKMPTSPVR